MDDILELCETFREHSISTIIVCQELSELDHLFKPNNWLKQHHIPMRRKPLRKYMLFPDELQKILPEDTMREYTLNQIKTTRRFGLPGTGMVRSFLKPICNTTVNQGN